MLKDTQRAAQEGSEPLTLLTNRATAYRIYERSIKIKEKYSGYYKDMSDL